MVLAPEIVKLVKREQRADRRPSIRNPVEVLIREAVQTRAVARAIARGVQDGPQGEQGQSPGRSQAEGQPIMADEVPGAVRHDR